MASIRQQIIDNIETRLRSILAANGYQTNIGNNIFTWLTVSPPSQNLPAAVLRDPSREVSLNASRHLSTVSVEVEVFGAPGFTDGDIRTMVRDVVKAFGTDPTWSGLALETALIADSFVIDTASNAVRSGLIKFSVSYRASAFSE